MIDRDLMAGEDYYSRARELYVRLRNIEKANEDCQEELN